MSPPPFSAAMCPLGTVCRFLRTPPHDAVSLQECGGREKQAHSHCQDTQAAQEEGGRNIALLDKWQCCDDTGRK